MSRRTKLLITALFLVLLAIPIGYVACTWGVEHPLRCRYLGQGAPEERSDFFNPGGAMMVPVHLEVENTSSVRLCISSCLFSTKGAPIAWLLVDEPMWMPAGSVKRYTVHVNVEEAQRMPMEEMTVFCQWTTATREPVQRLFERLERWLWTHFEYRMTVPERQSRPIPVEDASTPSQNGTPK